MHNMCERTFKKWWQRQKKKYYASRQTEMERELKEAWVESWKEANRVTKVINRKDDR